MDTVPLDEFGVLGACSLPVDEQCVRVSLHPGGQHGVVRYRNRTLHARRDRDVYYQGFAYAREHLHHLIERLGGEGIVVADVDDYHVSELTERSP